MDMPQHMDPRGTEIKKVNIRDPSSKGSVKYKLEYIGKPITAFKLVVPHPSSVLPGSYPYISMQGREVVIAYAEDVLRLPLPLYGTAPTATAVM